MRKSYGRLNPSQSLLIVPAVIFALSSVSLPVSAGALGDTVGGAVGGVGNAVGGAVSGIGGAVSSAGNTVGGVGSALGNTNGGTLGGTKATVGVLNEKGALQAKARSDLIDGIRARADVLSKKNLAKLCVGVGGGSGCGSGNRHQLLGLIDARLEVLRPNALLKVCASVGGAGCGGGTRVVVGGNPGGGNPGGRNNPGASSSPGGSVPGATGGNAGGPILSSLSDSDQRKLKLNCRKVMQSPASYQRDMVAVCRVLQL